ncbi:type VI secretion system tube protein TssD [Erwinia sp. Leaf53]|uniref:Hcp family type VI secretion system effector n=1 Tax=Erwinia sp. Leaf53 TaxID=1736225 RepID=UPI00092EEF3B|nr:type VI secretion system tube protein TssD [Erwinia sp. Leaf53]
MSNPAHIWLTDENGSPIVGGCLMPARLGSIEIKSLTHNVSIPVDPSWGKLTSTRVHAPIVIQKEFDRTTPVLFRALCEGRTLKSATIKLYQIIDAGIEEEYFNILLENVKVTNIAPCLLPGGMTSTHMETIELRYEAITWKHTGGNILYRDAWNHRVVA